MRDQPDGAMLLDLARRALIADLLPALPEAARYRARMVANAMAIAAREMSDGDGTQRARRRALAGLFDEAPVPAGRGDPEPLDEALTRLNWWLVAEIRGRRWDGDAHVHALLQDSARARLRLANPKALRDDDQ